MRLFVAICPPAEAARDLRRHLIEAAGPGLRLTPVERWHITLAFLGEVAAERVPEVEGSLSRVTVPVGTPLRLRGGGRFTGRSTVLWAGVEGELAELHEAVRVELGMPEREFIPHLTVAYRDLPGVREALAGYAGPVWPLHEIALVRSVPGEGYTTVRSW